MSALSSQLSAAGFPGPFPTGDGLSTCIPLSACVLVGADVGAVLGASSGVDPPQFPGTNTGALTLGTKAGALTLRAFNSLLTSMSSSSQLSGAPLLAIVKFLAKLGGRLFLARLLVKIGVKCREYFKHKLSCMTSGLNFSCRSESSKY